MSVWVLGAYTTPFRKWPERDFRDLSREAVEGVLADAGVSGEGVDSAWFGNCGMSIWGQASVRGQTCLSPLQREGVLPVDLPITHVDGACATGSVAFRAAVNEIRGGADCVLALGVEKVWVAEDPRKTLELFNHGIDQRHPDEWRTHFAAEAARVGDTFAPHPHRVPFLDVYALEARRHMARYGTTVEQLAAIASKNHAHGMTNDKAQYRSGMTAEEVLKDREVVPPLTRAMCAPVSDGAAAVLVVSESFLKRCPPEVRARALRVRATILTGGRWRGLDDEGLVHRAGRKIWEATGMQPGDVDVVELHDSNAWAEVEACEGLGFCPVGEGGPFGASGATGRGGERPINLSGGLVSKGHPIAATGLSMIEEITRQLRGEAGERQLGEPATALAQNAGGMVSFDEALCGITVLERP